MSTPTRSSDEGIQPATATSQPQNQGVGQHVVFLTTPSGTSPSGVRIVSSDSTQPTLVQQQVVYLTAALGSSDSLGRSGSPSSQTSSAPFQQHLAWTTVAGRDDVVLNPQQNANVQRQRLMTDQSTDTSSLSPREQQQNVNLHGPQFLLWASYADGSESRSPPAALSTQQPGHHRFWILAGQSEDANRAAPATRTIQQQPPSAPQPRFVIPPGQTDGSDRRVQPGIPTSRQHDPNFVLTIRTDGFDGPPQRVRISSQQQDPSAQPPQHTAMNTQADNASRRTQQMPSNQQQYANAQIQQFMMVNAPPDGTDNRSQQQNARSPQQNVNTQQPQFFILTTSSDGSGNRPPPVTPTGQQQDMRTQRPHFVLINHPSDNTGNRTRSPPDSTQQQSQQRTAMTASSAGTEPRVYRVMSASQQQSPFMQQQQMMVMTVMSGSADPSTSSGQQQQSYAQQVEQFLLLDCTEVDFDDGYDDDCPPDPEC